jgi:hypothetical protein
MLSPKERRLAAHLLNIAADKFSNHGCNDIDKETIDAPGFTDEEKVAFVREMVEWNGDPEEMKDEITPKKFHNSMDWILMRFLADKLEKDADESRN